MIEERISKKEVIEMYNIDSSTFENWVKHRNLPVIQISTHKKFIRKSDLIEFENNMMK